MNEKPRGKRLSPDLSVPAQKRPTSTDAPPTVQVPKVDLQTEFGNAAVAAHLSRCPSPLGDGHPPLPAVAKSLPVSNPEDPAEHEAQVIDGGL